MVADASLAIIEERMYKLDKLRKQFEKPKLSIFGYTLIKGKQPDRETIQALRIAVKDLEDALTVLKIGKDGLTPTGTVFNSSLSGLI